MDSLEGSTSEGEGTATPAGDAAPEAGAEGFVADPSEGAGTGEGAAAGEESGGEDFDPRAAFEKLSGEVVRKDDLVAINRQLGHIASAQRAITALQKAPAISPAAQAVLDDMQGTIDALTAGLSSEDSGVQLPEATRTRLAEGAEKRRIDAAVTARLGQDDPPPAADATAELTPEQAAAWKSATGEVRGYARAKGIDPAKLTAADWDAGVNTGSPEAAVTHLQGILDGLADAPAKPATTARQTAKAAGEARQDPPGKSGAASFDLNTLSGLAQARKAGAIDEKTFLEKWGSIRRSGGSGGSNVI